MQKSWHALVALCLASTASAALQVGDSLKPYEVKNSRSGQEYCPVCAIGGKTVKIVAFGKLGDGDFWRDLEQLQTLASKYPKLGIFAQVIDGEDLAAIKAEAARHGVKFPVVVAVEKDWDSIYQVEGISRTIYYAQKDNKIDWTVVGLDENSAEKLAKKLSVDLAG